MYLHLIFCIYTKKKYIYIKFKNHKLELRLQLYRRSTNLHLPFNKGGNVVFILKDGESLQQVVFQPLPVLCDLFTGRSCVRMEEGGVRASGVSTYGIHR